MCVELFVSLQEVVARIVAKMRATRMWSGVKKCAEKYCLCLEKPAYMQWCQLGHKEGLKSDTEIAIFLLHLYVQSFLASYWCFFPPIFKGLRK